MRDLHYNSRQTDVTSISEILVLIGAIHGLVFLQGDKPRVKPNVGWHSNIRDTAWTVVPSSSPKLHRATTKQSDSHQQIYNI